MEKRILKIWFVTVGTICIVHEWARSLYNYIKVKYNIKLKKYGLKYNKNYTKNEIVWLPIDTINMLKEAFDMYKEL